MDNDHGFKKACPTGNHMTEPVRERKEREYTAEQEDRDMDAYFERKEEKDAKNEADG